MNFISTNLVKLRNCFRDIFPYNTDASIELVDSLSSNTTANSVVQLTENPHYTRHYSTITSAISSFYKPRGKKACHKQSQLDKSKKNIQNTLCQHIEVDTKYDYHLFAIDSTVNPRPYSKKVKDRGFVKCNEVVNSGKPVTIGHNYSCVAYLARQKTWVLPLSIDRVPTSEKDAVFGIKQWCEIVKDKNNNFTNKRCVGVFDAAYSNAYCVNAFITNKPKGAMLIARLHGCRILQRPYKGKQKIKGRPIVFDKKNPFNLKEEDTLGKPANTSSCPWTTKKGKKYTVFVDVWYDLRMRGHDDAKIQDTPIMVARITVRNQHGDLVYNRPLWSIIVGSWPDDWPISNIWHNYHARFDIEHFFRFGKSRLLMASYQSPDALNEEIWQQFCMIAHHQLYHARKLTKNIRKPWESKKTIIDEVLSPSRTQRGMSDLLKQLPIITEEVKPRGKAVGRELGAKMVARDDHEVVKKAPKKVTKNNGFSINYGFKKNSKLLKPRIKYHGIEKKSIPPEIAKIISEIQEMPLFEALASP